MFAETGPLAVLPDGQATLYPGVIDAADAQALFDTLATSIPWRQEDITLFGKRIPQPRLIAWQGDASYTYSGLTLDPAPWTEPVQELRDRVSALSGADFNSVLLNFYRTGQDSMGWHSDNEASLGPEPTIASVSLGAERRFQFRRRSDHGDKRSTHLRSGDILIMSGTCQRDWDHHLPKARAETAPRINLTFRWVVG